MCLNKYNNTKYNNNNERNVFYTIKQQKHDIFLDQWLFFTKFVGESKA